MQRLNDTDEYDKVHNLNRIDFLSTLGVDIYHPEFCDIRREDGTIDIPMVRKVGLMLLDFLSTTGSLPEALSSSFAELYMKIYESYELHENPNMIILNSVMIAGFHARMCGIWLKELGVDVYNPDKYNVYMSKSEHLEFVPTHDILCRLNLNNLRG